MLCRRHKCTEKRPALIVAPMSVVNNWRKEAERAIASAEEIGRKGLILTTMMKLKQACNHPAHFLKDDSE